MRRNCLSIEQTWSRKFTSSRPHPKYAGPVKKSVPSLAAAPAPVCAGVPNRSDKTTLHRLPTSCARECEFRQPCLPNKRSMLNEAPCAAVLLRAEKIVHASLDE
jgi:hypothetical protein